jgi:3-(3-hydroxy-phenyl)propionate hydroxylase
MPDSRFRFEFMLMPGEDPADLLRPEVAESQLLGGLVQPGSATIERTATYTFFGAVATAWRHDRVLLAGDAAHLMPPFLGQGMCSGLRDVANLAWKLDRVITGVAPANLLDTYELERRPHVSQVIQTAVDFGRVICVTDPDEAARRDETFRADTRPLDQRFTFRLPALTPGPLVLDGGGGLFPQPAVDGAVRLDDWVGRRFLVLAADSGALGRAGDWWRATSDAVVCAVDDVPDDTGMIRAWFERRAGRVAVVRPDRYVLGVTDDLDGMTERIRPWIDVRTPA